MLPIYHHRSLYAKIETTICTLRLLSHEGEFMNIA